MERKIVTITRNPHPFTIFVHRKSRTDNLRRSLFRNGNEVYYRFTAAITYRRLKGCQPDKRRKHTQSPRRNRPQPWTNKGHSSAIPRWETDWLLLFYRFWDVRKSWTAAVTKWMVSGNSPRSLASRYASHGRRCGSAGRNLLQSDRGHGWPAMQCGS
jgi:hypothetical protein